MCVCVCVCVYLCVCVCVSHSPVAADLAQLHHVALAEQQLVAVHRLVVGQGHVLLVVRVLQYTQYSVHPVGCTVLSTHSTQYTQYSVHTVLSTPSTQYTQYSQYTVHPVLSTHSTQYTLGYGHGLPCHADHFMSHSMHSTPLDGPPPTAPSVVMRTQPCTHKISTRGRPPPAILHLKATGRREGGFTAKAVFGLSLSLD